MSPLLTDTHGYTYQLETPLEPERGSYGALFEHAVVYRARRCLPSRTETEQTSGEEPTNLLNINVPLSDVLITYVPLTTPLQNMSTASEAASLELVLRNISLRRQVHHPYLRSLVDAFYTDQVWGALRSASDYLDSNNSEGRSAASLEGSLHKKIPRQKRPLKGYEVLQSPPPTGSAAMMCPTTTTALVVVEEYVTGCSLADYADAVARKYVDRDNITMQHDAMAIASQLTQLLLHIHLVGPLLCRYIPLECVHLSVKEGCVKLRLPLCAVVMFDSVSEPEDCTRTLLHTLSSPSPVEALMRAVSDRATPSVYAPEAREALHQGDVTWPFSCVSPHCADVWALGLLMLQLCSLRQSVFSSAASATERLAVMQSHLHEPKGLLPSNVDTSIAEVIYGCLRRSPTMRPTLLALLKSAAFSRYGSNRMGEPNVAIIRLAEAVVMTRKDTRLPAAAQQIVQHPQKVSGYLDQVSVDATLVSLSLQDLTWTTPDDFRDAFVPDVGPFPQKNRPMALPGDTPSEDPTVIVDVLPVQVPSFPLAAAAQQAHQDVSFLHELFRGLGVNDASKPTTTKLSAHQTMPAVSCEHLQNTGQLPDDMSTTTALMQEFAEHLSTLEHTEPDLCFLFVELLLEGFANSASDVATVAESVSFADALMDVSARGTSTANKASPSPKEFPLEDGEEGFPVEHKVSAFSVAETLHAMPSMPVHVISSDRAANTSAVLYNTWLRKQRKKHSRMEGYGV